ncbi:formate dehydrogenase subunit delta [Marinobacter sp. KMM 10035]|uniref:formate dehydrogenase subunit delta n=1 Tax=Marinobacter sp. KMM 10035 TaxID=3134034 RepID=UPI00397CBACD
MSDQQLNNLIKMLDQIIANNLHHGDDEKVTDIAADHLQKFWARSMKQQIIAYANQRPDELSILAKLTVDKLEPAVEV